MENSTKSAAYQEMTVSAWHTLNLTTHCKTPQSLEQIFTCIHPPSVSPKKYRITYWTRRFPNKLNTQEHIALLKQLIKQKKKNNFLKQKKLYICI